MHTLTNRNLHMKNKLTLVSIRVNGYLRSMFVNLPCDDNGKATVGDHIIHAMTYDIPVGHTITIG